MASIAIFAVALVAIYVVKAVSIARSHDSLAQKSASFSWVAPEQRDESAPTPWLADEAATTRNVHVSTPSLRPAGFSA